MASIAFGVPAPALDGNIIRVLSRFLGKRGAVSAAWHQKVLKVAVGQMLQKGPPGDLNQSLMELGALICQPDRPRCAIPADECH